jgi:hypothetical protein
MPQVGTVSTLATARTTLRHPRALHGTAQYSDRHSTAIVAWLCSHSGSVCIGRSVLSWSACAPAVLVTLGQDAMPTCRVGYLAGARLYVYRSPCRGVRWCVLVCCLSTKYETGRRTTRRLTRLALPKSNQPTSADCPPQRVRACVRVRSVRACACAVRSCMCARAVRARACVCLYVHERMWTRTCACMCACVRRSRVCARAQTRAHPTVRVPIHTGGLAGLPPVRAETA